MSKFKIKDFEGLNVSPFAEKVSQVDDINFLSELEVWEKANGNRTGAKNAINRRQGELVDNQEQGTDGLKANYIVEDESQNTDSVEGKPETNEAVTEDNGEEQPEQAEPAESEKTLAELAIDEFKETLQSITDVEGLKSILETTRESKNEEMEQLVIERLAEVQVTNPKEEPKKLTEEETADVLEDQLRKELSEITNVQALYTDYLDLPDAPEFERVKRVYRERIEQLTTVTESPAAYTKEDLVKDIKATRLELDKALQFSVEHNGIGNDCNNNIFLAKAWLGKVLASYGTPNPYAVDVKTVSDIPPTEDKNEGEKFFVKKREFRQLNALQGVLQLREMLDWCAERVERIDTNSWAGSVARTNAYTNICEAKFHLGNELSKLRK